MGLITSCGIAPGVTVAEVMPPAADTDTDGNEDGDTTDAGNPATWIST